MPLHSTVEFHAYHTPNKTAIIFKNERITYHQLNCASNHLSRELINSGVKPGSIIPIALPRTPELIITINAILKIGAIYTLINPNCDIKKISEILLISKADKLVTNCINHSHFKNIKILIPKVIYADTDNYQSINIIKDSDIACVFFTSGSTGTPKAVLSKHESTIRLFKQPSQLKFSSKTIIPLAAAFPWDAFSLELWGALINGGTLYIIEDIYLTADVLKTAVGVHKVNTVWITSSLFNSIIEDDITSFKNLKYVLTGGERLSVYHVQKFLNHFPEIELINGYGPVETTIFATTHKIKASDCRISNGIPIGTNIPDTQIFVLGHNNKICSNNQIGEICIAGSGLAIGYLNDIKQTEEKFRIIDTQQGKHRVYFTGDLGFIDAGLLHYCGRKDRQIKILGHRIDLDLLEQKITESIKELTACRLVAYKNKSSISTEIAAFYISSSLSQDKECVQKAFIELLQYQERPNIIHQIERFPITSQGKVDDTKLLKYIQGKTDKKNTLKTEQMSTTNKSIHEHISETITSIAPQITIDDSTRFTSLGLSSLDIGRICTRINKILRLNIQISVIYKYPTIISLSNYLNTCSQQHIQYSQVRDTLNEMQKLYLMTFLRNPTKPIYYCLMIWKITGKISTQRLQNAINYAHFKNSALRTIYTYEHNRSSNTKCLAPVIIDLSHSSSKKNAIESITQSLSNGLNPVTGNLWNAAIIRIKEQNTAFFGCVVHHIAFDGYSEHLLAQDISKGYELDIKSFTNYNLTTPIHEIDNTNRQHVNTLDLKEICSTISNCSKIKWPKVINSVAQNSRRCISHQISTKLYLSIKKFALNKNVTLFNVLLYSFTKILSEIVNNKNLCIGVPVRQRDNGELQNKIGCYINTTYLHLSPECFTAKNNINIKNIRIAIEAGMKHQDIPVSQIIQEIHRSAPKAAETLSQVMFALHDNPEPRLKLQNLKTQFLRQPYLELPFDLHTEIWPIDNKALKVMVSFKSSISGNLISIIGKQFVHHLTQLVHQE